MTKEEINNLNGRLLLMHYEMSLGYVELLNEPSDKEMFRNAFKEKDALREELVRRLDVRLKK